MSMLNGSEFLITDLFCSKYHVIEYIFLEGDKSHYFIFILLLDNYNYLLFTSGSLRLKHYT
jgi:hypothetical protein